MTDLAIVEDGTRIEIGECRLDTEADIALDDAHSHLDEEERARADSFVFARDRARFIRAHGYVRQQLGAMLGMVPKDVPIVAGEGGKPYVEGGGASYSLSHSASRAVVAITRGREIGIDIETIDGSDRLDDQLDDLARLCLIDEELDALDAAPPEQRVRLFLAYWTAKEARMKLTGEGMALDPRAIALRLSSGLPVGYLRPSAPRADLRFIPLSRPGAICCLAVGRDGEQALTLPYAG